MVCRYLGKYKRSNSKRLDKNINTRTGKEQEAPPLSVVMPVFNAAIYLKDAVQSILSQSFHDFELLLIDDGSTDNTTEVLSTFRDARLRIIRHEKNRGLVSSLNEGIDLARGQYFARMDGDDIALPDRFQKQMTYLEGHKNVSVLATRVELINADGDTGGVWEDDKLHVRSKDIRSFMPYTNCIAHPSVIIRMADIKKFRYTQYPRQAEDWDLWLRMLSAGKEIHKLDEVLLRYRIHTASLMAGEKDKTSLRKRLIRIKWKFLVHQFPGMNKFIWTVFYSILRNIGGQMRFEIIPSFLRNVKRVFTSSPVRVLKEYDQLKSILSAHDTSLVFFFPYTHIGGAERVHADIVKSLRDKNPLVIFTNFSANEQFLQRFKEHARVLVVPHALHYPFTERACLKLISAYLNKRENARILGCNSGFFYDLVPYLSKHVEITDLVHAFRDSPEGDPTQSLYLPVSRRFKARVFVSAAAMEDFKAFCLRHHYTRDYLAKLVLIYNCTEINEMFQKPEKNSLHVIFVGRNSPEKRVHLFKAVARELNKNDPGKFSFEVIGMEGQEEGISFSGEISRDAELKLRYRAADVLVITSSREGFPMVIMEAMANGVIPVATSVGDIPNHIIQGENGFCVASEPEVEVVKQVCEILRSVREDHSKRKKLQNGAYQYACAHFSVKEFEEAYRQLLG